eukprot:7215593-Prymnesium_polylepis.1
MGSSTWAGLSGYNCLIVIVIDVSNQRHRTRGAETGPARYVDGTARLTISPLNDMYLVPEASQSRVALEYRLIA